MSRTRKILIAAWAASYSVGLFSTARGAVTTDSETVANMVYSGSPNSTWSSKGAVEISNNGLNATYPGNDEYALAYFPSPVSQLNSQYGANGWTITSVSVTLASTFPTAGAAPNNAVFNKIGGGSFTLNWLSNNGWGSATWNTLGNYLPGPSNSNLEESQGTFNDAADGTSPVTFTLTPTADFLNDISSGTGISLLGTPNDSSVGYLFNTAIQGNPAVLNLTAASTPEPAFVAIFALASAGLFLRRVRR